MNYEYAEFSLSVVDLDDGLADVTEAGAIGRRLGPAARHQFHQAAVGVRDGGSRRAVRRRRVLHHAFHDL